MHDDHNIPLFNMPQLLKGFTISHQNTRSLDHKLDQVKFLLSQNKFDIFAVTESWPVSCDADEDFKIDGYEIPLRSDRKDDRGWGGIALYIKSSINHREKIIVNNVSIEYLMVDMYREHAESIALLTVYQPDNKMDTIFIEQLEMLLDCATSNNKESIIVGDFNIDMLGDGNIKERLNRVMNTYQHTLHIHEQI